MKVRYYGHVGVPTGYGDAANEMCMALLSAGVELEISTDGRQLPIRYMALAPCIKAAADLSAPDVVIVHTLPLDCVKVLGEDRIAERYPRVPCVAYTTWEGSSAIPPEFVPALIGFDQVWVPSSQNRESFIEWLHESRVVVVPHAFDEDSLADRRSAGDRPVGRYRFYYIGAWTGRKNVPGLIRAYMREFRDDEPVQLVIHSAGAHDDQVKLAEMACGIWDGGGEPPIRFVNQRWSDPDIIGMHRSYDCFVTATRGEAWNLPAFHAVLAGRMVIAPRGQGSDEYLSKTTAIRYASTEVPAWADVRIVKREGTPQGHEVVQRVSPQGISARANWQEPDLIDLASMMRTVFTARASTIEVGYDLSARFGRMAVGERAVNLLKEL